MLKRVNDRLAWEGESSLQPPRVALWQIIGIVSVCFLSQITNVEKHKTIRRGKIYLLEFTSIIKTSKKNQTSIDWMKTVE